MPHPKTKKRKPAPSEPLGDASLNASIRRYLRLVKTPARIAGGRRIPRLVSHAARIDRRHSKEIASTGLTLEELRRAKLAHRVMKAMETPSLRTAKKVLARHCDNMAPPNRLTTEDFDNADKLFGRSDANAGKSVTRPIGSLIEDNSFYEPHLSRTQTMYGDLLFVNGMGFLITVSAPLYHTQIDQVESREAINITAALKVHILRLKALGVSVDKVYFDGETSISNSDKVEAVLGVRVIIRAPDAHVSVAERRIRVAKERARAAIHRLDFNMPRSLIPELLSTIAFRLNYEPVGQRVDPTPSAEILGRRKLDLSREASFSFGEYIEVNFPGAVKNTMRPRVEAAIALRPCVDGWWVKLHDSWETVRRKHGDIHQALLPSDVVKSINDRARREQDAYFLEVQTIKARKAQGKKLGKKQKATEIRDGWVLQDTVLGDEELGDKAELDFFALDDKVFVADGIQMLWSPHEGRPPSDTVVGQSPLKGGSPSDTVVGRSPHEGRPPSDTVVGQSPLKGGSPSDTVVGRSPHEGRPPIDTVVGRSPHEGRPPIDTVVGQSPLAGDSPTVVKDPAKLAPPGKTVRKAASKRLKKEAERLFKTVLKSREQSSTAPCRISGRSNKGSRKPRSNSAKVKAATAAFMKEHGETATRNAIIEEIVSFIDDEVFEGVYRHLLTQEQRRKILRTKLVLKAKSSPTGEFEKIKARICAGGDAEDKESFLSLYSPTTSNESAFATLAIAAYEGRVAKIIDLQAAYLKVDVLDGSETYVKLNELESEILIQRYPAYAKFLGADGCILARLKKSLYGIVQASGNLYRKIRHVLTTKMNFTINPTDACTFNRVKDNRRISICLYVDDLLITATDQDLLDNFTAEFKIHFPKITEKTGKLLNYLGMFCDLTEPGKCKISMPAYTARMAALFERAHFNARSENLDVKGDALKEYDTPAGVNLFEINESSPPLGKKQQEDFHSIVATALFMAKRARPDLLCATSFLTTRVQAPTVEDWSKLRRLVSYAAMTKDKALVLEPKSIRVEAYTDASFATHYDRRSHSGTVVTIGGAPIYCGSKRQKINAKSAAEAEMIAISDASTIITWAQHFLEYQGYENLPPAQVWEDNKATLDNLERGAPTAGNSRHYEVRYFYLSDLERRGVIKVKYLSTDEMTADLLTKGLPINIFSHLSEKLMNSASDLRDPRATGQSPRA